MFFQKLFLGRNGPDQLSLAVMIAACVINFLPYGFIPALLLMAYAFYRMFSKNVNKRRTENYKFMVFWNKLKSGFQTFFANLKGSKTHKIFTCPKCGQKLRVPKGKGKVNITCSKCQHRFVKQT